LPEVLPSGSFFGETKKELFGGPIPVMAVAGDQQSALFGQGCLHRGMAKNTYGTGCFMLMHTGTRPHYSDNGLLTTCLCGMDGEQSYALEGSVFIGGAVVQWLKDKLKIIRDAKDTEEIALSVEGNGGVYFVPAFVGLGAPYWNMECKGTIAGITGGTSGEHIVRAALESIAYQSYTVVKCMEKDSGIALERLKVDGGASANNFLMQFQADLLDTVIQRPSNVESTSQGVFYLAGLGTGLFSGITQIEKTIGIDREFSPRMAEEERNVLIGGWNRAVRQTVM
jgi:glycerol kinase